MAKLTKRKALQVCYELWMWLSENPRKNKRDWPKRSTYAKELVYYLCPCCTYLEQKSNETFITCNNSTEYPTENCLLYKIWPDGCERHNSPYLKYIKNTQSASRKKYALQIANATKKELDKLPPLKKRER